MTYRVYAGLTGLCALWFVTMAVYFWALPGGMGLDGKLTEAHVLHALDAWSEADKTHHIWGTQYLDSVFPVGLTVVLLLGVRRYTDGHVALGLAGLVLIYLGADILENLASLELLLNDARQWAAANAYASAAKYASVCVPVFVVVVGLWREWREWRDLGDLGDT